METDEVVWHDLEHCGYRADLPVWRSIAGRAGPSSTVELGAGSGRVSLALAADGHRVTAIDQSPVLLSALRARRAPGTGLETVCSDVRDFRLAQRVATVLAPALLVQLTGGSGHRRRLFDAVAGALVPGGLFAAACDGRLPHVGSERVVDGTRRAARISGRAWTTEISAIAGENQTLILSRTRRTRSQRSICSDEVLERIPLDAVAAEAAACGLRPLERIDVPGTGLHSGVTVMVFRAG
ncbi:MAG: class I SAM-dependent methyltransferase [Actinomycetes bacterium]